MIEKFKTHPGEAAEKEDWTRGNEPSTPEEMAEAREAAGVTTPEKAMARFEARKEKMKRAGEKIEKVDFHNPKDFAFFEDKLKGAVENKEIQLGMGTEKCADLFAVTNDPVYLDKILELLRERETSKYDICDSAVKLIERGKSEFIQTIINLENENPSARARDRARLDKYERDKIVCALLSNGIEPKKAVKYLPAEISESAKIEEILEKQDYKKSYIEGLIKLGELDKAKKILAGDENWQLNDLRMSLYLAGGEKKEDLEILGYSNILELLKKDKVDKEAACNITRKGIMSDINAGKGPGKENMWPYQLSGLIKYSNNAEDIGLAKQTYEELLKEIKEEKITVDQFRHVCPEGKLLDLSSSLVSSELDKETEEKILGFLEKIDFAEPKEWAGHPERVDNPQYDHRPEIIDKLLSSVWPGNKRIADFILEKSQHLGDVYFKTAVFKLGEDYQKERVLDSLEREISINRAKVEELKKTRSYGDEKEEQRLNKTISRKEWLAASLAFEDYTKEGGEEGYQRIKKMMSSPILRRQAGEHFLRLLDNLIKGKNHPQVLKFLADPEIGEESERLLNWRPQNVFLLVDYLISGGEFDKAKEIVEGAGNKSQLVAQLITEMYKRGAGKENIENSLSDYALRNPKEKADLLFYSYLELMKLTK